MITKNNFYIGDFYIPQAKPSISEAAIGTNNEFSIIVGRSEEECLISCLGNSLYRELVENIDTSKATLLKDNVDLKWDRLMNGHTFNKPNDSKNYYWRGLRFKSPLSSADYNASLLTGYVYYMYYRNQHSTSTSTGEKQIQAANSNSIVNTQKVVKAWNYFVKETQGLEITRTIVEKNGMIGIDYFKGDFNVNLYSYINYMNEEVVTYENFTPKDWGKLNEFQI